MRNRLLTRDEHAGKSIEELESALRLAVTDILLSHAEEAAGQDMPRLLVGHFSVAEAHYGSERTVMLGRDVAVPVSVLADPVWDYVALGHIHRHQDLHPSGLPPVVYSGSLERIDFGEEEEAKGFCWVELMRGATRWRFQPVSARPFHTVRVDATQEADPTEAVVRAVQALPSAGAVVRVLVLLKADQEPAFREPEVLAALAGAASVAVAREVQTDARARLGDLAPEALTPLQLVERYFQARGEGPERIRALLSRAGDLLRDSD
jgi:exonuclease SbcD